MEKSKILTAPMLQKITAKVGNITKIIRLNKGLTNTLFVLHNHKEEQYIVKVFCHIGGLLLHRSQEVYLNKILQEQQLTAELLLSDKDFFLFKAIIGQNLTKANLQKPLVVEISRIVNIINNIQLQEYDFFHRDFLQTAYAYTKTLALSTKQNPMVVNTLNLLQKTLATITQQFPLELALCHNDYNLDNFMYTACGQLLVIDFEYSSVNDIYFEYAALQYMLGQQFNLFVEISKKTINVDKLQYYTLVVDCLSILWCFLMNEKHHNKKDVNYLAWASGVYNNLPI